MTEDHSLWEAIGNLHRTRRDLIGHLAQVANQEGASSCSFCQGQPPDVVVLLGPGVTICDRCVALCSEILALRAQTR